MFQTNFAALAERMSIDAWCINADQRKMEQAASDLRSAIDRICEGYKEECSDAEIASLRKAMLKDIKNWL